MITKTQVKHIRSLEDKKYRYECKEFVVEGEKMVDELLNSNYKIKKIYTSKSYLEKFSNIKNVEIIGISDDDLKRISFFTTANNVLAIVEIPNNQTFSPKGISLVLDKIQDPGNLGSIIRIADWFNIEYIYCSIDTVDVFNSKVVQASMGSLFRTKVIYTDLQKLLSSNKQIDAYAAILNGIDINSFNKINEGFLVIGNESKGISQQIVELCKHKISIQKKGKAESLNAAIAAGIICHSMVS